MTTVYVFCKDADKVEKYEKSDNEIMPYVYNKSLTVAEFKGSSNSSVVWTDKKTMESWSRFWEGGHSKQSQHYAGRAFDIGQNLSSGARNNLRKTAINSGLWNYVEPAYLTPSWVHVENKNNKSAGATGYPALVEGQKGNYVLILQDALNTLGYKTDFDGYFGTNTKKAVIDFQKMNGIPADGMVSCLTWTTLTQQVTGIGKTPTLLYP